jgi:CheY-like chemotaxis protein
MARRRILVVEDDPFVRAMLEQILSECFEVEAEAGGIEGLERAMARSFDAVLTDVCMPGLDGVAMAHAIRAHGLGVPLVFFTGSPHAVTREGLAALQPARLVVKPCDFTELRAALRELGL